MILSKLSIIKNSCVVVLRHLCNEPRNSRLYTVKYYLNNITHWSLSSLLQMKVRILIHRRVEYISTCCRSLHFNQNAPILDCSSKASPLNDDHHHTWRGQPSLFAPAFIMIWQFESYRIYVWRHVIIDNYLRGSLLWHDPCPWLWRTCRCI